MTKKEARRQKKLKKTQKKSKLKYYIAVGLLLFFAFKFLPSKWDKKSSLSLVVANDSQDITVAVFDPELAKVTTINIPSSTQVTVAHELGTWKIGSVWQLGLQEKFGGQLLADTIMKSFSFPVDAWSASPGLNIANASYFSTLKSVVTPFSTSLTFKDKINLALFSLRTSSNHLSYDLSNTSFLKSVRLTSGEEGYIIQPDRSPKITHIFSDPLILSESQRIGLIDASSFGSSAKEVASIVQALGSKVYFIDNVDPSSDNCTIAAKAPKSHTSQRLAILLDCEVIRASNANLDINITLGEGFTKRF